MPTLTVNGRRVTVESDATLLDAARAAGVDVPTLCQFDGLEPWGGCRLCVVDMSQANWDDDWFKVVTACNHPVEEGMTVVTDSERIIETRRVVLDLLLARCPETPLVQQWACEYGVEQTSYTPNAEPDDCILCGLCTRVCDHIGVSAISSVNRGWGREIAPPFNQPPPDCIGCLACAEICPTDCIPYETSNVRRKIWGKEFEMLRDPKTGEAVITREQAQHFAERSGVPMTYFETSDRSKRREMAKTFEKLQVVKAGRPKPGSTFTAADPNWARPLSASSVMTPPAWRSARPKRSPATAKPAQSRWFVRAASPAGCALPAARSAICCGTRPTTASKSATSAAATRVACPSARPEPSPGYRSRRRRSRPNPSTESR
jgi:ferredoxin